jgi:hypothetical protein
MNGFKGTINLEGRPKGSHNQLTKETREAFSLLVQNNLPKLQQDLDSLNSLNRLKIVLELAKFIIPQLKSIDASIEMEARQREPIIINFQESKEIVSKLENKY